MVNALRTIECVGELLLIGIDVARETFLSLGERRDERACVLLELRRPFNQRGQQAAPKRVYFNGFSHARSDHDRANFGVHPCELRAWIRGHEQAIGGVNPNSVTRAFGERVEYFYKRGK